VRPVLTGPAYLDPIGGLHGASAVLTALGAALPFLVIIGALGGIGYAGWRRFLRRKPGPAADEPTAAG